MTTTELSNQQALVFPDSVRFADIVIIERVAEDPAPDSVNAGRIFFNYVTRQFKGDDGSAIQVFGQGASGSTIHNLVSGTHFDTAGTPSNLALLRYLSGTAKWTTFNPGGANQVLGLHGALADFEFKTIQGDNVNTFVGHAPGVISIASAIRGESSVTGLVGATISGVQYSFECVSAILVDTSNLLLVVNFPGSLTNYINAAGPIINGRDQAAAFLPFSDVHVWYIWNGTVLASISTVNAPSIRPTLPPGFTHCAYVTSFILDASANIIPFRTIEKWNYFNNIQMVAVGGVSTIEAAVPIAFIPFNSIAIQLFMNHHMVTGLLGEASIAYIAASLGTEFHSNLVAAERSEHDAESLIMPIINRQFFYKLTRSGGTGVMSNIDFGIQGYQVRGK